MAEPGYYKTNYRAVRLREMIRWYGWRGGFRAWIKTRFMCARRAGRWMPGLWAENECRPEALSADFWQATKPHRADFEKLGFVQCHLLKPKKSLDPIIRDSGGIFYLDPTFCHFGQLLYSRSYVPAKNREFNNIVIAFTAVFEEGSFSCTNNKLAFDYADGGKVVRLNSFDVAEIHNRFREELQRRRETPRSFADIGALRQWFDERQMKNFKDHVRRRLFIRMTESEVAALWAEQQRYGPVGRPPPLPRRRFQLEFLPTTLVLVLLAVLIMNRHRQIPDSIGGNTVAGNTIVGNTIEYQGQQFKMRMPYATYEDYKDDPDNLDTNELGRIEQTIEAVKIPESFKDRKAFLDFMFFDLEFPGYGLGFLGASTNTDDGSTLEVALVEVPQRDKERVIVMRGEPGGALKLADDFIYAGSDTNDISRVRLEHRKLEYFDQKGMLVRKKLL